MRETTRTGSGRLPGLAAAIARLGAALAVLGIALGGCIPIGIRGSTQFAQRAPEGPGAVAAVPTGAQQPR